MNSKVELKREWDVFVVKIHQYDHGFLIIEIFKKYFDECIRFSNWLQNFLKNRLWYGSKWALNAKINRNLNASALGSNGCFWEIRPYGSRFKIIFHSNSRVTPFFGGFESFWTKSDLFQNVKKKWFHPLPFF